NDGTDERMNAYGTPDSVRCAVLLSGGVHPLIRSSVLAAIGVPFAFQRSSVPAFQRSSVPAFIRSKRSSVPSPPSRRYIPFSHVPRPRPQISPKAVRRRRRAVARLGHAQG